MVARTNRLQDLLPLVLKVRQALTTIAPKEVIEVDNY